MFESWKELLMLLFHAWLCAKQGSINSSWEIGKGVGGEDRTGSHGLGSHTCGNAGRVPGGVCASDSSPRFSLAGPQGRLF